MLFVFLALYFALGIGCLVMGLRRRRRSAVACGITAITITVVSLAVGLLYALGVSHWTVSLLQVLLSPMPESLLYPETLMPATNGSGIPQIVLAAAELLVAIILWAIPTIGIVAAARAPGAASPSDDAP